MPSGLVRIASLHALCALAVLLIAGGCDDAPAPKPPAPVPPAPVVQSAPTSATQGSPGQGASPATGVHAVDLAKAPLSTATSDNSIVEISGISMPKPATWTWQAPTMAFRTLQYAVPAQGSGEAAELVFSQFAAGDGGAIEANVDRWKKQFRGSDGAEAPIAREELRIAGLDVIITKSEGAYQGVGAAAPRPDMAQLGAIIRLPASTLFVRLVGPKATVLANEEGFRAMIRGIQPSKG